MSEFAIERRAKDGKRSSCKECLSAAAKKYNKDKPYSYCAYTRRSQVLSVYGLTVEDYERMLEEQEHKCKICGIEEKHASKQRFHVDHCHDSGLVRGLLCKNCNNGLGMFKDSSEFVLIAAKYLKSFGK